MAQLTSEGLAFLQSARWPGNVRELRNVLRRAAALSGTTVLSERELRAAVGTSGSVRQSWTVDQDRTKPVDLGEALPIKEAREKWMGPMEKEYLTQLMERCGGDLNLAAEQAGIHRKSLERLLRQHNIQTAEFRDKE